MLRRLLLVASMCGSLAAADAPCDVPDPFGLGERLALIDWLHGKEVAVPEGTGLAELRELYRATAKAGPKAAADADHDAAAVELWRKHNVNPAPGASTEDIRQQIAALDATAAEADRLERRRQSADDLTPGTARLAARPPAADPTAAAAAPPRSASATPVTPPTLANAGLAEVREIKRPNDMGDRVRAFLISPERSPILVVVCDPDLIGLMERELARWPAAERLAAGIDGTLIIHGHSDGGYFNHGVLKEAGAVGSDLSEHLRRNREYYETMAGTRARRNIDFAVMTGCNAGGFNQEVELRDGLGYRPLHRVFTAPESYDAGVVVVPAIIATGSRAWDRSAPYRAKFTWHETMAGPDGGKRSVACYGAVDQDALDIKDHLHRFLVAPDGIREQDAP